MIKTSLSLAICTMHRREALAENLRAVLDEARELGVSIYISDDSPDDDDTKAMVLDLKREYDAIHYHRSVPTLGHDRNLIHTMLLPDTDYVWLLADSLRIRDGMLTKIFDLLAGEDFVFLNAMVADDDANRIDTSKPLEAIKLLLWNQALTGATIYNRRVLNWLRSETPEIKRNFPQLSVILGYASKHETKVKWIKERMMISAAKTSYWRKNSVIANWVGDWASVVTGFANVISKNDLPQVLSSHARKTGIFSFANLLRYRMEGQYRLNSIGRPHFFAVVPTPAPFAVVPLLIPPKAIALGLRMVRGTRRMLRRTGSSR